MSIYFQVLLRDFLHKKNMYLKTVLKHQDFSNKFTMYLMALTIWQTLN